MKSLLLLFLVGCSAAWSPVSARVDGVSPSLESRTYADVAMTFENPNATECRVAKYVVSWPATAGRTSPSGEILDVARPAGSKTIEPASLVIPAKGTIQRRVRIDELDMTTPASHVTVDVTCR
jgi:hypothetical protein